jgi:hypothetical protein
MNNTDPTPTLCLLRVHPSEFKPAVADEIAIPVGAGRPGGGRKGIDNLEPIIFCWEELGFGPFQLTCPGGIDTPDVRRDVTPPGD